MSSAPVATVASAGPISYLLQTYGVLAREITPKSRQHPPNCHFTPISFFGPWPIYIKTHFSGPFLTLSQVTRLHVVYISEVETSYWMLGAKPINGTRSRLVDPRVIGTRRPHFNLPPSTLPQHPFIHHTGIGKITS